MVEEHLEWLLDHRSFDGLSVDELKILLGGYEVIDFAKDETLVSEGKAIDAFFIVLQGRVRVMLPDEIEGKVERRISEIELNSLGPGDCFGELSIINNRPASASVVVSTAGRILKVPVDHFRKALDDHDHLGKVVYHNLLRLVSERLVSRESEYDAVLLV